MSLDLIIIAAGAIYGYVRPGKEDRGKILKKGLKIGLILGIALAILGMLVGGIARGFMVGITGTVGLVFLAFIVSVEFIIGTFIGDFLEHKFKNQ
jgi:hypothetical protein